MSIQTPLLGVRHLQVLLLLLAIFILFFIRFSASISIVAMTKSSNSDPKSVAEYDWTNVEINYVLGGYFWGLTTTQILGSYLCRRHGVKLILFMSVLGSSVLAFVAPYGISYGGWRFFCAIRIIQGIFQGVLYPCVFNHLSNWCPVEERIFLGAITLSGQENGALVAMLGSGYLASSSLGWPSIFYISGACGIIWCLIWMTCSSNSPLQSNLISCHEKQFILGSVEGKTEKIPFPSRAVMKSLPFWALLAASSAESFGFTTFEAQIPSYLNGVLDMDINQNGLYSSLPYLALWLMGFVYLIVSIVLLKKQLVSLTILRRTINTMALWLPAIGFIGIGFLDDEHKFMAVLILTIMMGFHAGTTIGNSLNSLDLSPNHAGMLVGIINTSANGCGLISPLTTGLIVHDEHDRSQWQCVFFISALVFFFGNLFYITCGSTEIQPWNDSNFLQQKKGEKEVQSNE